MSEYIEVGQPLQFTDPNTPTRVGEIVENVSDIYNIPSPRLGMQVFVKSEKKSYVITSLKSKVIGGVDVPEAAVEAFEPVGAKSITWNNDTDLSNMNNFVVAGVYDIKGERKRGNDNLPILNTGGGHSFNARLTVLDSSITGSGKNDDKCITQVLSFSNRLGQGEVYIRTGKGSSLDNLTWENWSTLQRNVNVDTVTSLDNLVDNGIYSGVYVKNDANIETFVMVVINNYALAGINNLPKSISQFKYSVSLGGSFAKYETRVGGGNPVSFPHDWEILNKDEISSMISAEIKKVNDRISTLIDDNDPDTLDSIKDLVNWVNEHGSTVEGLLAAINANADKIEETINYAGEEFAKLRTADNTIKAAALRYDGLTTKTTPTNLEIKTTSVDLNNNFTFNIPSATTKSAGVMSAEDKMKLDNLSQGGVVELIEEVTYSELVALRNNASLVEGALYRITDYATMTAQVDTSSAGHAFDIIVEALDKDVLSEDAKAVWHDGDDYFAECDLTAWTLKYCLDNDTLRFAWADAENGKGVIYYMKDERDNECPYDFKNIMFKDYFTFSYMVGGVIYDGTIRSEVKNCYGNIIKQRWTNGVQNLNGIVFKNTAFGDDCHSNTFGNDCRSNTFGNYCYSNTFGNNCHSNTFGNYCYSNTFDNYCYSNTFDNYCYNNTFDNYCSNNNFGNDCRSNTFDNYCSNNNFGNDCRSNTFGYDCSNRRIDDSKLSITLNDEYYDDGSGQLVPIKHPDLSTQPGILPYKFMGNYVYEQLVPIEGETTAVTLAVAEPFILEARLVGNGFSGAADVEYINGELHITASNLDKALYLKIEYAAMENGNNFYGYSY